MNDLISVIVLTYNSQSTVVETLDSVLSQTYERIEIIIADDGSTDNTLEIVNNWKKINDEANVKIVSSKINLGIPHNCNQGILASSGKYVKLIAGDDILKPNAIEIYYIEMQKCLNQKVILQSREDLFGSSTYNRQGYIEHSYKVLSTCTTNDEQKKRILSGNFILAPAVGLIEKDIFQKVGMFDEKYRSIEDYPFYCKLAMNGYTFALIDESLVKWRVSDNSANMSPAMMNDLVKYFFDKKMTYLISNKMYVELVEQFTHYLYLSFKIIIKKLIKRF